MTRAAPIPDETSALELRRIRILLTGLFVISAFGVLYFARALMFPLVLALILTLTLRPVSRGLSRIGIPPLASAALLVLTFGGGVAVIAAAASGPVSSLIDRVPEIGAELRWKLRDVLSSVEEVQRATEQVEDLTGGSSDDVTQVVMDQSGLLTNVVGSLASAGTSLAVALILTAFLLASGEFFPRKIVESSRRVEDKARALEIVQGVERQISRYLASITLINAGLGVSIGLALWLLGLPNAFVWGLAAFLLNYLPFLGAIVGSVAVGLVGIVTFDTVGQGILCSVAYYTLTSIEGSIVTPYLVGRHLSINTVAVFVTVILWVWLWGAAGAFLAVPVLVVLKTIADATPSLNVMSRFIGQD